jgi:flagellar hook-associated protein 2
VTSTVDGLVSGLNTTSMIQQLMAVEAAPQDKLKSNLQDEQVVIQAYQAVNTKMSALQTAAETLTSATGWQSMKATSSDSTVTATAGSTASAGQLTFNVTQLARAQVSTAVTPASGDVVGTSGLTITVGTGTNAVTTNIAPGDLKTNDAQGVADAINAKGLTVKAAVVTTDNGTMLQFTSTKTGTANGFTIDGLINGAPKTAVSAQDAKISIGDQNEGGYTVSSASNTFASVMPGLSLTVSAVTSNPVTITTVNDSDKIATAVAAMVSAANDAMDSINSQATYNADTKTGGPLLADTGTRLLAQRLLSDVSNGKTDYGSFKQLGISLDQSGKIVFDHDAFVAAYTADPAKVQSALQTGLAATFDKEAKSATNSVDGTLTTAIQGGNAKVKDLNDQIADWDIRLQTKQAALQTQFSNLEVALGKLKDQSSWLSGQLASLPSGSSS